ncbi:hypothetical protein HanRHA438_Chr06g0281851 [Helianthus annuus]|nr:hypothetical protein HanRHA438_Chr06g0281851 [Helianthus annuus]
MQFGNGLDRGYVLLLLGGMPAWKTTSVYEDIGAHRQTRVNEMATFNEVDFLSFCLSGVVEERFLFKIIGYGNGISGDFGEVIFRGVLTSNAL